MNPQNDLTGHIERNRKLLDALREKQVDLLETRSIELHFWAWGQPNSVRLVEALYSKGFTILVRKPAENQDGEDLWNVEAGMMKSIMHAAADNLTEMLIELAARFNAVYDGWGTSI